MPLLFSNPIFAEDIIRALSHTLLHSLWQGMLLAMLAGGIIFFTKKTAPAIRYNLLTAALLFFITGIIATFSLQVMTKIPVAEMVEEIAAPPMAGLQPVAAPLEEGNKLFLVAKAINMFNSNAGWIVSAWLLVIVLRCIYLAVGLYGVYQLKRKQTFSPGEYWNGRLTELCRRLQINKQVQLLQTGIARIPAVIGYFKPVILFPAGMLASLQPGEVEAILVHELAHIRRRDFLVNLLQYSVEIIFFFNPAVKWVSSLIRSERENCCDEIAVNQTDSKRNYINALIAFQHFDMQLTPRFANAFASEKNQLMHRVKRIIYNNNKTLDNMEKKLLAAGMIITSVVIFAFSSNNMRSNAMENNTGIQTPDTPLYGQILPGPIASPDTIPGRNATTSDALNGTINSTLNGKKYKIVTRNNRVTELYVNGKKIPAEKMSDYRSVTNKILAQSRLDMQLAKKDMQQAKEEMEESNIDLEEYEKEMAEAKLEIEKAQQEMAIDIEASQKELEKQQKEFAEEMELSKKEMEQAHLEMELARKEMAENMQQSKKEMEQARLEMENAKQDMAQLEKDMARSRKDMYESKKLQGEIIREFIKEKIIKDKKELSSYKLSSDELIVNGVKQPGAIHKRLKDKYVKGSNGTIEYNYDYNRQDNK